MDYNVNEVCYLSPTHTWRSLCWYVCRNRKKAGSDVINSCWYETFRMFTDFYRLWNNGPHTLRRETQNDQRQCSHVISGRFVSLLSSFHVFVDDILHLFVVFFVGYLSYFGYLLQFCWFFFCRVDPGAPRPYGPRACAPVATSSIMQIALALKIRPRATDILTVVPNNPALRFTQLFS